MLLQLYRLMVWDQSVLPWTPVWLTDHLAHSEYSSRWDSQHDHILKKYVNKLSYAVQISTELAFGSKPEIGNLYQISAGYLWRDHLEQMFNHIRIHFKLNRSNYFQKCGSKSIQNNPKTTDWLSESIANVCFKQFCVTYPSDSQATAHYFFHLRENNDPQLTCI